jgi:hypothetical protein
LDSSAKAKDFALEILKLDEPSQWQLERILRRAIDYGYGLCALEVAERDARDIGTPTRA